MPVDPKATKGTSPSPSIQKAIDKSWGKQDGCTNVQEALNKAPNKQTEKVG